MDNENIRKRQEWLRSLVDRHSISLTRYAASITGDIESARDAVQETFFRLTREWATFRHPVTPWLFKVCRNCALDHYRKEKRMMPLENNPHLEQVAPQRQPGEAAERKEAAGLVLKILGTLPPKQREVIRLKFQNGLSYREIAEVTDHSVSNVGFLLHTALKNLRQRVKKETDLWPLNRRFPHSSG